MQTLSEITLEADPGRALANQRLFADLLGRIASENGRSRKREFFGKGPPLPNNGIPALTDFVWHLPPESPQEPAPPRQPQVGESVDPALPFAALARSNERSEELARSRLFDKRDALDQIRRIYRVEVEVRSVPELNLSQICLRDRLTGEIILEMPYNEILSFLIEARRLAGVLFTAVT